MGVASRIKNFFFRLLIYFIIFLWPYMKLQNLFQNVEEFKSSLLKNLAFYQIKSDQTLVSSMQIKSLIGLKLLDTSVVPNFKHTSML